MARAGVTYHDVSQAAAKLSQQNRTITVDSVRETLGTGSKSTIAPLLKTWKAKQEGTVEEKQSGLPSELLSTVKGLYLGMQQQADANVEAIRSQSKSEIEKLNQKLIEIQKANETLSTQLAKSEQIIGELKEDNASLKKELQLEQQNLIEIRTKESALLERLGDRQDEIARFISQLKQAQSNLDHYRTSVQQQRDEERASFDQQRMDLERLINQANSENQTLLKQVEKSNSDLSQVMSNHDLLKSTNESLDLKLQQQRVAMRELQNRFNELSTGYKTLDQVNVQLESKIQKYTDQNSGLEKSLVIAEEKIAMLEIANDKKENKLASLAHDNLILTQEKALVEGQFKQLQRSIEAV